MFKRITLAVLLLPLLFCLAGTARAQGGHMFLGDPRPVSDKYSSRFGIRYNTQGFDAPDFNWNQKIKKWKKKHVPDQVIEEMLTYPGDPEAIGRWVDDAFDKVRAQFMACGGTLAQRASRVSAKKLSVTIMPTAFYEPYWKIDVAGVYYPKTNEIKVLNIYYMWAGAHKGWLRHARDLIEWEMGNYFAMESGIQPEPRPTGWPCNMPLGK